MKLPQGGANSMITSSRAIATVYGRLFTETFTEISLNYTTMTFISRRCFHRSKN